MPKDPWQDIRLRYEPGSNVRATVRHIANFGAFAEIEPGVDGLVLIPNITHGRISHPSEMVTVGQQIEAVILVLSEDHRQISLSMKALERPSAAAGSAEVLNGH